MEILFLVPPIQLNSRGMHVDRVYGCNYGFDYKPPIHLLLLATIAKELGCKARVLDCPAEGYNLRKFNDYIIRNGSIDIVVFFTVWLSLKEDLAAAEIISDLIKKVKIIFTGSYPSWMPDLFIKNERYFVIRGEPEKAFTEFVELYKSSSNNVSNIKNLSFLRNGKIINNDSRGLLDIDTIPIPDRSMLRGSYFFNRLNYWPATVMCVSRGCSYNCRYCAPDALDQAIEIEFLRKNVNKPPLRLRNIKDVIKEFNTIVNLGYRAVEVVDNQFVWNKERVMAICDGIKHLNLKWICYARPDHLKDKEMLKSMKEAGCKLIYIGTESFCQKILDDIHKEISVKDNYKAVELVRECGIEPEVSVLLGASEFETEKTVFYSIREARKLRAPYVHYSIALPLPHTRLYAIAKTKGWIKTGEFSPVDNIREGLLDLPFIKAERLKIIIRKCYVGQYLSLRFIARQILNLSFWQRLNFKINSLGKLLKYRYNHK